MKQDTFAVTLEGLLSDLGPFARRSGLFDGPQTSTPADLIRAAGWQSWFPTYTSDVMDGRSGRSDAMNERIRRVARIALQLISGEQRRDRSSESDPTRTWLVPVLSEVGLSAPTARTGLGYGLNALGLSHSTIFPRSAPEVADRAGYARYWHSFEQDMALLARSGPVDSDLRLASLLALLRKYLWCIPAEYADELLEDVSLYDHAKVAAAIASCLVTGLSDEDLGTLEREGAAREKPIALMVRGDFSGIQNFIYRITRPEATAEFEHVAKRLRGRSFYLGLLGQVVTDFLIRRLGLSAANVLFLGGGRFDLLVPLGSETEEVLSSARATIESWLLEQFTGDLGLQLVSTEVRPRDLGNMRSVYAALETRLQESKQRKWERYLLVENFHIVPKDEFDACRVCHTTSLANPGICDLCEAQAALGKKLPHTTHLAFVYGAWPLRDGLWLRDFVDAFGVQVGLLDDAEAAALRLALGRESSPSVPVMVYRLNDSSFLPEDASRGLGVGFQFLANAAPVARETITGRDMEPVAAGDVLPFEALAEMSTGAKRIGVLKADVDRLGLIMSEGLDDGQLGSLRPTITRVATLSSTVELFFAGWLNEVCTEVARDWLSARSDDPDSSARRLAAQADGVFYVMYSGGDDLFIVGPWDAIILLAQRLRAAWSEYACSNLNVTISAGVVVVKPRYPVQRFAQEANSALEEAKGAGRDRISVFDRVVRWIGNDLSLASLLELGRDLVTAVQEGDVPRTLVHDIGRLERSHRGPTDEEPLKPMFTPRLYYTLARRLVRETREEFAPRILAAMKHVQIPVSYVSLITREE